MTDDPIQVERRVAAPPSEVYRYLTESSCWQRWQGVEAPVEAEPGGGLRLLMGDGTVASGRFVELVTNRRVVFTWGWREGTFGVTPGSSTVEIDLVPDGADTLIRLTHRGLPDAAREPHSAGWELYLGRLAISAAGGEAGPEPSLAAAQ